VYGEGAVTAVGPAVNRRSVAANGPYGSSPTWEVSVTRTYDEPPALVWCLPGTRLRTQSVPE
jgi:O-acetyl-ADP-ribose deacetylase (regulator of RNase III)